MAGDCRRLILDRIRERGPLTVAEYMELALYHAECGYYARAPVRTGRAGDFFTSVDLGSLFGELLAVQFAEMWRTLDSPIDLVEAGAGNGRLARDVLDWLAAHDHACYDSVALCLVERSPVARDDQRRVLGPHVGRLRSSSEALPDRIEGILYANELLDALPVHLVEMTEAGLREVHVGADAGRLVERVAEVSTPALVSYLARAEVTLEPGWRAAIGLNAVDWMREAARRLTRGFLVLIDYGHRAGDLFSGARPDGMLAAFTRHTTGGPERAPGEPPAWLVEPGARDITAHVDLTSLRHAAEEEGLATLAVTDQTYFLLGLGLAAGMAEAAGDTRGDLERRLALKTLTMPGGLGSTHKVMIFGRGVGRPALGGCSFGTRLT